MVPRGSPAGNRDLIHLFWRFCWTDLVLEFLSSPRAPHVVNLSLHIIQPDVSLLSNISDLVAVPLKRFQQPLWFDYFSFELQKGCHAMLIAHLPLVHRMAIQRIFHLGRIFLESPLIFEILLFGPTPQIYLEHDVSSFSFKNVGQAIPLWVNNLELSNILIRLQQVCLL